MIQIKNLQKKFNEFTALKDISIEMENGGVYGLVGQSGSGKSTLLRCINGLIAYDDGSLTVDGVEVSSLSGKSLLEFRKNIGMIFQNFSLLNRLDIYDNIALPMRCWGYSKNDIDARVNELLEMVHLSEKKNSFPRELSGGQKQRVAIARALALNPHILLCDEATSALDPSIAETIMELLIEINKRLGITVIVVTHQFSIVKRYCEKVFILERGVIAASGKCSDVFSYPPESLLAIMGEKDKMLLPETGKNIHIMMPYNDRSSGLISEMCSDAEISCSLLSAEQERFCDGILFSLFINVSAQDYPKAAKYLNDRLISWKTEGRNE